MTNIFAQKQAEEQKRRAAQGGAQTPLGGHKFYLTGADALAYGRIVMPSEVTSADDVIAPVVQYFGTQRLKEGRSPYKKQYVCRFLVEYFSFPNADSSKLYFADAVAAFEEVVIVLPSTLYASVLGILADNDNDCQLATLSAAGEVVDGGSLFKLSKTGRVLQTVYKAAFYNKWPSTLREGGFEPHFIEGAKVELLPMSLTEIVTELTRSAYARAAADEIDGAAELLAELGPPPAVDASQE